MNQENFSRVYDKIEEMRIQKEFDYITESSNESPSAFIIIFYHHLIKAVCEPERFTRSWVNSLNESRYAILRLIFSDKNKISKNMEKDLFDNLDDSIEAGLIGALEDIKKSGNKEYILRCKNFKIPNEFKDIRGFVFNSSKLREYIKTNINNLFDSPYKIKEIEKFLNDDLDDIEYRFYPNMSKKGKKK